MKGYVKQWRRKIDACINCTANDSFIVPRVPRCSSATRNHADGLCTQATAYAGLGLRTFLGGLEDRMLVELLKDPNTLVIDKQS